MDRRDTLGLIAGAVSAALVAGSPSGALANSPAPTFKRGYANGPFGLVHYQDTGGDGLPLVLLHQSPQSYRQFDSVLPELSKRGIRAIAIDTPGFGISDPPPFVPKAEDYARAVPPVLDLLHLGKSHVFGHHTGSAIASEVALQFPDRVLYLIMHGVHPMEEEERRARMATDKANDQDFTYEPDGSHLMKAFKIRWQLYGPGADPKLTTRVVAEKFIAYGPFWYGHHASDIYDFNAALPRIKHKALILTNTGDVYHRHSQLARRIRPDFAYTELQGGTIDIIDQQPAAWSEAVAAFLRS